MNRLDRWRKRNTHKLIRSIIGISFAFVLLSLLFIYYFDLRLVGQLFIAFGLVSLSSLVPLLIMPASLIARLQHWQQSFGAAAYGLLITAALVTLDAYFHYNSKANNVGQRITLLVVIALAGIVPTITMLSGWPQLRIFKASRGLIPSKSFFDFSPVLRSWFAYTSLFLIILPLFLYVAVPSAFQFFSSAIKSEEDPIQTTLPLEQGFDNVRVEPRDEDLPLWLTVDKTFFNEWFRYVLAASIATLVFSLVAVNSYVRRINRQLPRPIFENLATLKRVVIWEARNKLEIGDDIQQVQWTDVQHNAFGGIVLKGLYEESSHQTQKHAKQYIIISDMWARITKFDVKLIEDVQVDSEKPQSLETRNTDLDFQSTTNGESAQLRTMIFKHFNESELHNLCHDLDTDFEALSGNSKQDKVRELVLYFARRQRLPELIQICKEQHPNVDWKTNT